jgi:hypothetical protein
MLHKMGSKGTYNGFYLFALLMLLISCDKKENEPDTPGETPIQLEAILTAYHHDTVMALNTTYTTNEGYPFQLKELKFYLTQVSNGTLKLVDATKFDWTASGTRIFIANGKPNDFSSLAGYIGVIEEWNHLDPISFSETSPLYSTNANDMHWSWNPGYIFAKVEGSFDTIPGSTSFPLNFSFHLGMDENLKEFHWESIEWKKKNDKLHQMDVRFQFDIFLNGIGGIIDLKNERTTHSMPSQTDITTKAVINFSNALQIN